ncbi:VWA domain-containing protein [Actinokineospora iranica]|uniref:Ca-activated chloride channel family protein n=1 Tax=Actinokineospora iranica TaxID=1271860 RepID=A0A1G6JGA3_9PSEU|nr:substrate-binding domain-containing protein [Actinokineospora iranica]SDC17750.1 Ca-activated chloride channel family protein [Actinokineospora iranica]
MVDPAPARRGANPLVVSLIVGLVASVVVYFALDDAEDSAPKAVGECVAVELSSSTEKDKLLAEMAERYNGTGRLILGNRCAKVSVHGLTSGLAMDSLATTWDADTTKAPVPQVWVPSTSLWVGRLAARTKSPVVRSQTNPSLMSSPVVVAMPSMMADALRAKNPAPGWADLLTLATAPDGWSSLGHPEWGKFKLGRDNPELSSSGLGATIATFHGAAVAAGQNGLTVDTVRDARVRSFVHNIESSVERYGDDAAKFMETLYAEDAKQEPVPYISAIVLQEQLAYLYNRGVPDGDPHKLDNPGALPKNKLTTIYPKDGTVVFDHPYIVLASATEEQRAAAEDFRLFLGEEAQRATLRKAGFRDGTAARNPTDELSRHLGVDPRQSLTPIPNPAPDVVEAMVAGFQETRKKARVLLVLDVSGSMNDADDPANKSLENKPQSKLERMKPAAVKGLAQLGIEDEVGLWTFSSPGYTERIPIGRVGDVRQQVIDTINGLAAKGETALYDTVSAAHQAMTDAQDPAKINAIVLLSDGENTPRNDQARAELLAKVDASRQETSVRVFTIPYGRKADIETMRLIAENSRAVSYDAKQNTSDIEKVFVSAFSNL